MGRLDQPHQLPKLVQHGILVTRLKPPSLLIVHVILGLYQVHTNLQMHKLG